MTPAGAMQVLPLRPKKHRRTAEEIAVQEAIAHLAHAGSSLETAGRGCRRKCRDTPFFIIVPEDVDEESNGSSPARVGR